MNRWDAYFLRIAEAVALQSLCLNRQIWAVLVSFGKRIIATGYNGPPSRVPPCADRVETDKNFRLALTGVNLEPKDVTNRTCPRRILGLGHGEGREWCPAVHAEVNAIANAARVGIKTKGATLYLTCGVPCKNCMGVIINAGVDEIVCTNLEFHDDLTPWLLTFPTLTIRTYR